MDKEKGLTSLQDTSVFFVGIKGTGMAALAELFHKHGARVSGSDRAEQFYTDRILMELGIPFKEEFNADNLPEDTELIIHSAAYDKNRNPELREGTRRNITILTYPEALGLISGYSKSTGIAGTHGKTTTTALCGTILKNSGLPVSALVGASVSNLDGRSTYVGGDKYFIAETCEYRRHFLHFRPSCIVITNIEPDHLDYFSGYDDCIAAFVEYGRLLTQEGILIYCADDRGAVEAADRIGTERSDIRLIPYGKTAEGPFAVNSVRQESGAVHFSLQGWLKPFVLHVPGEHTVLNAAAAAAVSFAIADEEGVPPEAAETLVRKGIRDFHGSSRRSELIGEAGGIIFLDDYGHHPTEIQTTIAGIREFYPGRRLIVDFMSHTYSRTKALFTDFSTSFSRADEVIFHKIYGSAREEGGDEVSGEKLYDAAKNHTDHSLYFHEVMDAKEYLLTTLQEGDIFLTLGAGDNWRLGRDLFGTIGSEKKKAGNGGIS